MPQKRHWGMEGGFRHLYQDCSGFAATLYDDSHQQGHEGKDIVGIENSKHVMRNPKDWGDVSMGKLIQGVNDLWTINPGLAKQWDDTQKGLYAYGKRGRFNFQAYTGTIFE